MHARLGPLRRDRDWNLKLARNWNLAIQEPASMTSRVTNQESGQILASNSPCFPMHTGFLQRWTATPQLACIAAPAASTLISDGICGAAGAAAAAGAVVAGAGTTRVVAAAASEGAAAADAAGALLKEEKSAAAGAEDAAAAVDTGAKEKPAHARPHVRKVLTIRHSCMSQGP
jgi:hypothetical protein